MSLLDFFRRSEVSADFALTMPTQVPPTDMTPDPGSADLMGPLIDQELAVSQEAYNTRYELYQYSPDDLITTKGFRIFDRMYEDDQIHMAITALKLMRLSSGYEIEEASQDNADIEIADFVADVLLKIEGSTDDALFNIMGALEMGWSLNEKIWDFYKIGPYQGRVRLKALKSKSPRWFNPTVDDFNNVTGVAMISPPAFGRKLPADKFVIYSFMKRYENVFGFSRMRALYDWWWIKQVTRRALGVFIEKYGRPIAVGKYPVNMQPAHVANLRKALQQLKISSAITMPDGCVVDFLQAGNQGAEAYLQTIEKCDQQIVKVIMGQTLTSSTSNAHVTGGGSSGGSSHGGGMAAAAQAMDILTMYLDYIGRHVANGPIAQLIKDIVDYNYSGVTNYPTLKFRELGEKELIPTVTAFVQAAQAGIIKPSTDDVEHIREVLKFPSAQPKNNMRRIRYLNAPVIRLLPPSQIEPSDLPWAGYRPPTPSGPGLEANYAEKTKASQSEAARDPMPKPWRKLTKFEQHVDFAEAWDILDTRGEDGISAQAAEVIKKAVERLKTQIKKLDVKSTAKIKALQLPYRSELARVIRDGAEKVAKRAEKQARAEIAAKKSDAAKFSDALHMTPDDVLTYIDTRAFTLAGDISNAVLKDIKTSIYNGIRDGKSYKGIVYDIENGLGDYVDLRAADAELSGPRLETAVRTFVSDAYNQSRKSAFLDKELNGFVQAFQFSAILDDRTTPWCANLDGKIYAVTNLIWDEITPPTFYNCRSVLVAVTKVDDWDKIESAPPKEMPPEFSEKGA